MKMDKIKWTEYTFVNFYLDRTHVKIAAMSTNGSAKAAN